MSHFRFVQTATTSYIQLFLILNCIAFSSPNLLANSANPSTQSSKAELSKTTIIEEEFAVIYKKIVNSEIFFKLKDSRGHQLVDSVNKIIKEEMPRVEKEHLLMLSVTLLRQQGLAEENLPDSYRQTLKTLSKMHSKILTTYSDGHDQQVFAYPFAQSAKSTLDFFDDISLTISFLALINDGEYQQLINQLPDKASRQVNLLRPAINQLNKSQSEQLLFWAKNNQTLHSESILQLAIQSAQVSVLVDTLISVSQLPLHRYFTAVDKRWDASQQFEILKQIATIEGYASVSVYQIAKLKIDEQLKHDYLLQTLASKTAGSTSAAILSKQMSAELVDELAAIVQSQSFTLSRKNAFLAMLLSRNQYAFEQAHRMYEQQLIGENLAREVSAWFE